MSVKPMPPATLSHTASLQIAPELYSYIAQYIVDVMQYLLIPIEDVLSDTSSSSYSVKPPIQTDLSFKILFVGDSQTINTLIQLMKQIVADQNSVVDASTLSISSRTISDFNTESFSQRFDLGVLLHPHLLQPLVRAEEYDTATFRRIAIRLRDLFAHQSLLFMPVTQMISHNYARLNNLSFNDLGYTLITHDQTAASDNKSVIDAYLKAWQFNLYDYKPRPNWLNAKYWANPENFDKYRW